LNWTQLVPIKPPVKPGTKPAARASAKNPVKRTAVVTAKTARTIDAVTATLPVHLPAITGKVRLLAFTTDGKNGIFAGTDHGLFRSYDVNKGWEKISLGVGMNDNIFAIHSSSQRPGTIWIGTAISGVLVSHDDGQTWQNAGGAVENVPISSIASDPKRPDYIYVGSTQTFYLSRNGGQTWTRRGGNLPLGNFTSILINPDNTDEILLSSAIESDGGMFQSMDAGNKWKRIDNKDMKLASRRIWTMVMDPNDSNRIFAGTHSGGVYLIERQGNSAASPKSDPSRVTVNEN
jgi:photosystem II stability/assembly factor-like uncharacterized protein